MGGTQEILDPNLNWSDLNAICLVREMCHFGGSFMEIGQAENEKYKEENGE